MSNLMLEKYNFHWREGFFYNFEKRRSLFHILAKEIHSKQIIALNGLRRTGKTTLLKQIIDHLITTKTAPRENILFYSFDEEQPKIGDIIQEYESRQGQGLLNATKKVYVFLDEIQKLDNWQNQECY